MFHFCASWIRQKTKGLFKVKNDLSPEIMKEIFVFQENETYNLRSGNHLARKNIRTTQYGIESVSNLGAKLWNLLPGEIKNSSSLTVFKNKIRKWTPEKFPCKLCQTYTKKCWLYLISLRHLLDLHLYLDLKFKSLWESCGIEILSHQQIANIDLFLVLYIQNDFRILHPKIKICIFFYIIKL